MDKHKHWIGFLLIAIIGFGGLFYLKIRSIVVENSANSATHETDDPASSGRAGQRISAPTVGGRKAGEIGSGSGDRGQRVRYMNSDRDRSGGGGRDSRNSQNGGTGRQPGSGGVGIVGDGSGGSSHGGIFSAGGRDGGTDAEDMRTGRNGQETDELFDDEEEEDEDEDEDKDETGSVVGQVVDPDGNPAVGALVRYVGPMVSRGGVEAVTNGAGIFSLQNVPMPVADLVAITDKYSSGVVRAEVVETDPGGPWVTLQLAPAAAVNVRVTDSEGEPIAAAIVYVQAPSGELLAAAGTTSEDGLVSFSKLPAGVTWVQAERVGYSLPEFATDTNGRQQLSLASGETREVHLTLTLSAAASGYVIDSVGNAVAGAAIHKRIYQTGGSGTIVYGQVMGYSDGNGFFELRNVSDGQADLMTVLRGRGVASWTRIPESREVTLVLEPGYSVSGVVRTVVGQVVPGASVSLEVEGTSYGTILRWRETTGADGRFNFVGAMPLAATLSAEHPDFGDDSIALSAAEIATEEFRILEVSTGMLLQGFVESESRRPIPNAIVRVHSGNSTIAESATDFSGGYKIEVAAAESWSVSASATGFAPSLTTATRQTVAGANHNIQLGAGIAASIHLIPSVDPALLPAGTQARLQLVARDRPVPPFSTEWQQETLTADTLFVLEDMVAGSYRAYVNVPGVINYSTDVSIADRSSLRLPVMIGSSISGRAEYEDGQGAGGASVEVLGVVMNPSIADGAGNFVIDGIYPRDYTLRGVADTHYGSIPIVVPQDGDLNGLTIVLDQRLSQDGGQYTLGFTAQADGDSFRIGRVIADTNASSSGLQTNDELLSINGVSVEGWSQTDLNAALNGDPNTAMRLGLRRGGSEFTLAVQSTKVEEP
ncbi:MAG: hypothetical protein ACI8W8_001697 [Rhodothermales bacterium]